MPVPDKITTAEHALAALTGYAKWRSGVVAAFRHAHPFASQPAFEFVYADELPPEAPVRRGVFDPFAPPVAHVDAQRVTSVRPMEAATRPGWEIRRPLAVGANGVQMPRPVGRALAAVVSDLGQLGDVIAACDALARSSRTAGLDRRAAVWERESAELAAFAIRHESESVPTLGAAFLAEWSELDARYRAPDAIRTPPPVRPVALRA